MSKSGGREKDEGGSEEELGVLHLEVEEGMKGDWMVELLEGRCLDWMQLSRNENNTRPYLLFIQLMHS